MCAPTGTTADFLSVLSILLLINRTSEPTEMDLIKCIASNKKLVAKGIC